MFSTMPGRFPLFCGLIRHHCRGEIAKNTAKAGLIWAHGFRDFSLWPLGPISVACGDEEDRGSGGTVPRALTSRQKQREAEGAETRYGFREFPQ